MNSPAEFFLSKSNPKSSRWVNFATDIENPEKSNAAGHTTYGAMVSGPGKQAKPNMWHWMAGINSKSQQKAAAFLFLTWANSKPTCLFKKKEHKILFIGNSVMTTNELYDIFKKITILNFNFYG